MIKQYKYGDHETAGETSLAVSPGMKPEPLCQAQYRELYELPRGMQFDSRAALADGAAGYILRLTNSGMSSRGRDAYMHAAVWENAGNYSYFASLLCTDILTASQTEEEFSGGRAELPEQAGSAADAAFRRFADAVESDRNIKEQAAVVLDAILRARRENKRVCVLGAECDVRSALLAALSRLPAANANAVSFITQGFPGRKNDGFFVVGAADAGALDNPADYITVSLNGYKDLPATAYFARCAAGENRATVFNCFEELNRRGLTEAQLDLIAAVNSYKADAPLKEKLYLAAELAKLPAFAAEAEKVMETVADSVKPEDGAALPEIAAAVTAEQFGKIVTRLFLRGMFNQNSHCRMSFLRFIGEGDKAIEWLKYLIAAGGQSGGELSLCWLIAPSMSGAVPLAEAELRRTEFLKYAGAYQPQFYLFWSLGVLQRIQEGLSADPALRFRSSKEALTALRLLNDIKKENANILLFGADSEYEAEKSRFSRLLSAISEEALENLAGNLNQKEHNEKLLDGMNRRQLAYREDRKTFNIDELCAVQAAARRRKASRNKLLTVLLGFAMTLIFAGLGCGVVAVVYGVTKYFLLYYTVLPVLGGVAAAAAYLYAARSLGKLTVPRRRGHLVFTALAATVILLIGTGVLVGLTFAADYIPMLTEVLK